MQSPGTSLILRSAAVLILYFIVVSDARPTSQQRNSVVHPNMVHNVNQHARTSARKRHAEIRVTDEYMRYLIELKRKMLLNGMVSAFESKKIKNLQFWTQYDSYGRRYRQMASFQVYPTRIPHRKLNTDILNQIDGSEANGLRVRVVNTNPTRMPTTSEQYSRYVQQTHDAAAVAKTCQDMQELMARNNLRFRVSCQTNPSRRRVPVRYSSHRFTAK